VSSENRQLTLKGIYDWIKNNFKYYQQSTKNWKNAIRHTLSLHDCFVKLPRSGFGKGNFWSFDPTRNTSTGIIRKRMSQKKQLAQANNAAAATNSTPNGTSAHTPATPTPAQPQPSHPQFQIIPTNFVQSPYIARTPPTPNTPIPYTTFHYFTFPNPNPNNSSQQPSTSNGILSSNFTQESR